MDTHFLRELSPNFIVEFPEEFPDFWYGIESDDSNKKKFNDRSPKIKTFLKSDPSVVYEKPVDIWHIDSDNWSYSDYWVRSRVYNNHIILQDYSGITIYDMKLNVVFTPLHI